jgi:hypothetical protein
MLDRNIYDYTRKELETELAYRERLKATKRQKRLLGCKKKTQKSGEEGKKVRRKAPKKFFEKRLSEFTRRDFESELMRREIYDRDNKTIEEKVQRLLLIIDYFLKCVPDYSKKIVHKKEDIPEDALITLAHHPDYGGFLCVFGYTFEPQPVPESPQYELD